MFTQESSYPYALTAALAVAVLAAFLIFSRALHRFQIFW